MSRSATASMQTIDQFIQTVGSDPTKTAADGGKPLSEPGSQGGETTHPVKNVDDRLEKAKEGERSKENTADVKKEVPASVDATSESVTKKANSIFDVIVKHTKTAEGAVMTPGSAEDDSMQIGTKKAPTGEDKKNETSSAKAGKEDPGSTHPARTDNDSLDGHKYAFDENTTLEKLSADMATLGNSILAAVAWDANSAGATKTAEVAKTQAGGKATPPTPTTTLNKIAIDEQLAHQLGWELAGLVTNPAGFDKQAADALARKGILDIIKQASADADNYIACAREFMKRAEGETEPPTEEGGGGAGGGAALPSEAGGGEGGGGEDAMMSALGGGAGAGGGAEMGGGAGGGAEMGGGAGGAGGGNHISPDQLVQILDMLGVTPEQIEQAAAGAAGGGAGGAGGTMGGGAGGGEVPGAEAAMAGMGGGAGAGGAGGAMGGAGGGAPVDPAAGGGAPKMAADKKDGRTKSAAPNMRTYISELVARSQGARKAG